MRDSRELRAELIDEMEDIDEIDRDFKIAFLDYTEFIEDYADWFDEQVKELTKLKKKYKKKIKILEREIAKVERFYKTVNDRLWNVEQQVDWGMYKDPDDDEDWDEDIFN